jgi:hypothetical protein
MNFPNHTTDELIAGTHISDVDLFGCFNWAVPLEDGSEADLWETRKRKMAVVETKSLEQMLGFAGKLTVKEAHDDEGDFMLPTMVDVSVGCDKAFRAARVAQLEAHYGVAKGELPEEGPEELPSMDEFFDQYTG